MIYIPHNTQRKQSNGCGVPSTPSAGWVYTVTLYRTLTHRKKNICNMRRCSRVGQYIECIGKITVRKTDDKLYYMQYGFVALYLSFVCVKAGFILPTSKAKVKSVLWSFLSWHGSANRCLIAQNHHKLPTIMLSVRCWEFRDKSKSRGSNCP